MHRHLASIRRHPATSTTRHPHLLRLRRPASTSTTRHPHLPRHLRCIMEGTTADITETTGNNLLIHGERVDLIYF